MIKIFVAGALIFIILLVAIMYRNDGNRESEENVLIVFVFGMMYVCLFIFLTVMTPEIKSFMVQRRSGNVETSDVAAKEKPRMVSVNETEIGVVLRKSLVVTNIADVDDFVFALKRKDVAYLDRMVFEGRAFFVTSDVRVYRSDSGLYDGIVFITFLEGQFTNWSGYTVLKCVPTLEEYLADRENMYIPDSNR